MTAVRPRFSIAAFDEAQLSRLLPELSELWRASWQEAMPEIDFAARIGWFEQHMGSLLADGAVGRIAVEESNSRLLGFLTLNLRTGYLDQLAVLPQAKKMGIADALLAAARLLSPHGIDLVVNLENPRALRFYEQRGFIRTGSGSNPSSGRPTIALSWRPDTGE
jgi:putative acetyltransferase